MAAEDINFALDKQEMRRVKLERCALCSRDKENLFPQVVKVNKKTFNHLKEVANEFSEFTVLNQTNYIPVIDATIDDITLKLIDGLGYQVSFRMCQECLHRIAWKHKYKKSCAFATS